MLRRTDGQEGDTVPALRSGLSVLFLNKCLSHTRLSINIYLE